MKVVGFLLVLVLSGMCGLAWAGGVPISVGFGGGLDASIYFGDELRSDGLLDFSPALAGFVTWTGSYPRVYRLGAQWTRLRRDHWCFCPDEYGGGASCCNPEVLDLAAVQLGVLWFEQSTGRRQGYGGVSGGVHSMRSEDAPTQWSPMLSVVVGTRLRPSRGWCVSIEGGGALVLGSDTGLAVVPVRVLFEF